VAMKIEELFLDIPKAGVAVSFTGFFFFDYYDDGIVGFCQGHGFYKESWK
jgi:hypothetical protein